MKVIDISQVKNDDALLKLEGTLREHEDYYEYCIVEDYEAKTDVVSIDGIQINDFVVVISESYDQFSFESIQFPKTYSVLNVVEWLDGHSVSFNDWNGDNYYIDEADTLGEVVVYKSMPIAVATRGTKRIVYNIDEEVPESLISFSKLISPMEIIDIDGE